MEKKNILIDYTKWLLKWLLIIAVALAVAQGVGILYENHHESEIDMLALSCGKSGTNDYLLRKKRYRDTPSRIFAGAYRFYDTTDISIRQLREVGRFKSISGNSYVFNDYEFSDVSLRELNRINLEMNFISNSTQKRMKGAKLSCKVIDVDEFYAIVEEETKKRQDKMKI